MEPPAHIETLIKHLAQFNPEQNAGDSAYRLRFERELKMIEVLWPMQGGEVFLDFMKSGELLLAESVEYYDSQTALVR